MGTEAKVFRTFARTCRLVELALVPCIAVIITSREEENLRILQTCFVYVNKPRVFFSSWIGTIRSLKRIACAGVSYSVMSMRDIGKPPVRGKTSPYGFFVKMCYEEHKKKYPNENVQVTEISKKCSEKWKV
ncbi:unnamed protein product, partial [Strongylus vulgaris]